METNDTPKCQPGADKSARKVKPFLIQQALRCSHPRFNGLSSSLVSLSTLKCSRKKAARRLPVCAIDLQGLYLNQPNLLLYFPSVCSVSRSNKNVHRPQCRRKRKLDPLIRGLAPLCCVLSCALTDAQVHDAL